MREYCIHKVNEEVNEGKVNWSKVLALFVDNYPWSVNNYQPKTEVKLIYTDKGLNIRFVAHEKRIRVSYYNMNEPVNRDSCVEFFLNPNPAMDDRYINFEINPIGIMHLGLGKDRARRSVIMDVDFDLFNIEHSVARDNISNFTKNTWSIEFTIPFYFIQGIYGEIDFRSGHIMKGNFYKCGDDTENPHYGCWCPIFNEHPDFHRSEFFGDLRLI